MNLPSFIVGVLVLAGLEVVTSSDAAAGRAAMLPGSIAGFVKRLVDPTIGLIPNRAAGAGAAAEPPPVPPDTVPNPLVRPGGGARARM